MTQQYTPVAWQDETTSQQGTLINAERLNQMQQAHHYADGFEEVDAVPAANPGVQYHKIVYCTADSTFYRWDGTEWTKDVDDETKALLQQEIARATEAEGELAQDIADETTARETADTAMQADITALQSGKLDKQTAGLNQTQVYAVRGSTQRMLTAGASSGDIPLYNIEHTLFAKMPSAFDPTDDTVVNYGWTTAQIGAEATARAEADTLLGDRITAETSAREGADTALGNRITAEETRATQAEQANAQAIANTYTKSETDTLLASKADKATTLAGYGITDAYTKTETDTLLAGYVTLNTAQTIPGAKTFTNTLAIQSGAPYIQMKSTSAIGVNQYLGFIQELDANGAEIFDIYPTTDAQGRVSLNIAVNGNGPIKIPSPGAGAPSNSAATIATLDYYAPMVRLSDYQIIDGVKIFDGIPGAANTRNPNIDVTTPPSGDIIAGQWVALDKNNTELVKIIGVLGADGGTYANILVRNRDGTYKAQRLITSD